MRDGSTLLGDFVPRFGTIGAGGWVTGIAFADDGTKIIRTDTFDGYTAPPGRDARWTHCLQAGINVPEADINIFYGAEGGAPEPWTSPGAFDVAIAPSNSDVRYIASVGRLYVTQDGGDSWAICSLPSKLYLQANAPNRMTGKALAVDPQNPAVCFFASPQGTHYTTDYGANWTDISTGTLPAPSTIYAVQYSAGNAAITVGSTVTGGTSGATGVPLYTSTPAGSLLTGTLYFYTVTGAFVAGEDLKVGGVTKATSATASYVYSTGRCCIAFDPSSSVTSSRKQGLYCFVNGSGLYHSANAGVAWSKVTDRPTTPTCAAHLKIGANSYVYLTGTCYNEDAFQFSRWDGSTWLEPTGVIAKSLAISPHNPGHVYICSGGSGLGLTKDYGDTWELDGFCQANARISPDIPWQAFTKEDYMSNGDIEFDPTENTIWQVSGIGAWHCHNPPTTINFAPVTTPWTSCSEGVENMVCFPSCFAPDGTLLQAIGDRAAITFPKAKLGKVYPAFHPKLPDTALQNSCGGDYAPEDNAFAVYATSFCGSAAFTTDRAETAYTCRTTLAEVAGATGIGGNIACFTKDKWVLVESNGGKVWRTSDRGLTWARCTMGTDADQFFHGYIYNARRVIVKDKAVIGRAYIYNAGSTATNGYLPDRGVWRTDDYGANWTQIYSGFIIAYGADHFHGKLSQYNDTSLLWCGGDNALGLWKLSGIDGATATKTEVTGSDDLLGSARFGEVYGAGMAKGAANSAHPAVLVCGFRMVTPANASQIDDSSGYGFWLSLDGMATWERIAKYLGGDYDGPTDVAGDPSTFARFVVANGGSGCQIVDYNYTQRWT
jgi:hypothetical protein